MGIALSSFDRLRRTQKQQEERSLEPERHSKAPATLAAFASPKTKRAHGPKGQWWALQVGEVTVGLLLR